MDESKIDKLALIELKFTKILKWEEMYFLRISVTQNADVYFQIISACFKDDDGNSKDLPKEYVSFMFALYYKMEFCPAQIGEGVDPEKFKQWYETFYLKLKQNNQASLFDSLMGKLLAFSPNNADGYPLADCVRTFIEEHFSKKLLSSFVTSIMNKRGVYSASSGASEEALSIKYKKIADRFRMEYPNIANIYDCISEDYHIQSENEKKKAMYE